MRALIISLGIFFCLFSDAEKRQEKLVDANIRFNIALMQELYLPGENVLISPFSIHTALGMCYDGAAGKTAREMRNSLHYLHLRSANHQAYVDLLAAYRKSESFHWANAVWAQENYNFLDSYIEDLGDYGSHFQTTDFRNTLDRERARRQMNMWVEQQTQRKIRNLIGKKDVDALTRLVLLNAIYFNRDWLNAFDPEHTSKDRFRTSQGYVKTMFMHKRDSLMYFENDDIQAISLPYEAQKLAMLIVMPQSNTPLKKILTDYDSKSYRHSIENLESTNVMLSFPKFSLQSHYYLKKNFQALGMKQAFTMDANFKRMNGKKNLMVDEVIHKCAIDINEEGTEAAGATAVVVREKSSSGNTPTVMKMNHPFMFFVYNLEDNNIIFSGIFEKPSKNSIK